MPHTKADTGEHQAEMCPGTPKCVQYLNPSQHNRQHYANWRKYQYPNRNTHIRQNRARNGDGSPQYCHMQSQ